jgi:RNA polymerase sigma-70 factor, ECF subfamily
LGALSNDAIVELVARAQRGDAEAFAGLARAFLRAAYAGALGIVGRPADAEDVAQEAFTVALERIETCREPARFAGWLLRIVRTRALNWLERRRLRDVPHDDVGPDGTLDPPRAEQAEERRGLVRALGLLPAIQRQVVLLHDLEGWTHAEIGDALELSEGMSRQHLFQARKVLRAELAPHAPGDRPEEVDA